MHFSGKASLTGKSWPSLDVNLALESEDWLTQSQSQMIFC